MRWVVAIGFVALVTVAPARAIADHSPAHAGIGVTIRKPTCVHRSFGVRVHNDLNKRVAVSLILWHGGYGSQEHLIMRLYVPANGYGRAQIGPDWRQRDGYKLGVFRGPRVFTPTSGVYWSRWLVNGYGNLGRCS